MEFLLCGSACDSSNDLAEYAFFTDFTLMRFLTRMDKLVSSQMYLSGERLIADVTHVHCYYGSVDTLTQKR